MVYAGRFEADFKENSYGFRPKRSQHMALESVQKACNDEGNWVVDADIKDYFDHIIHKKLLILLEELIRDRQQIENRIKGQYVAKQG